MLSNKKMLIEKNNEIEQHVLSIILNDHNSILNILSFLNIDDFLNSTNRLIFKEISELFKTTNRCDLTLLINRLNEYRDFFKEEPHIELLKIVNLYTNSSELDEYLRLIKNNSITFKLNNFGNKLSDIVLNNDRFNEELWSLQKEFQDIINASKNSDLITSKELAKNYTHLLDVIRSKGNEITGTSSGFNDIDEFTNGFQAGDLIILAARPSIGKTALALNFLINAAKQCKSNESVVMFSLEMSATQLMERMVSSETGVNSRLLRNGNLTSGDEYLIDDCIEKIEKLPIIIDESSNATILDIQSKLKKISLSRTIKLVVVDYLQLVQGSVKIGVNRQQEVAQISRALKSLARDILVSVSEAINIMTDVKDTTTYFVKGVYYGSKNYWDQDSKQLLLDLKAKYPDKNVVFDVLLISNGRYRAIGYAYGGQEYGSVTTLNFTGAPRTFNYVNGEWSQV